MEIMPEGRAFLPFYEARKSCITCIRSTDQGGSCKDKMFMIAVTGVSEFAALDRFFAPFAGTLI